MNLKGMKFDDILVKLGEFGRYQVALYAILCCFTLIPPWNLFISVFLSGEPDHWCKIPEWDSVDCDDFGFNETTRCADVKKQFGIPSNLTGKGQLVFDQCRRYNVTGVTFKPNLDLTGTPIIPCDAGWNYDPYYSAFTINQDFDLVCGSKYMMSLSQSIYYVGQAIGSGLTGILADRFGRKPALFLSLLIVSSGGLTSAFSVNIWMFMFLRLIVGVANTGLVLNTFVLANESIGPSKRNIAGCLIWVPFSLGYMLLSLVAYFVRHWRHLLIISSVVSALLFPLFLIIPESVRWLLAKGHYQRAEKIIEKMARVNKVSMTECLAMHEIQKKEDEIVPESNENIFNLFQNAKLTIYTLTVLVNLMVNGFVYMGLSLGVGSLGVNVYLAFAISGAIEVPGCVGPIYPMKWWGRRGPFVLSMVMAGTACLATVVTPLGPWTLTVALVGKFLGTFAYNIIYLWACEIFPTSVRNTAFGLCIVFSSLTNFVSPFILLLADVWSPLPMVIFGSSTIAAGGLAILLPETRGKRMPDTMDEGENIGWKGIPRKKNPHGTDVKNDYAPLSRHDKGDCVVESRFTEDTCNL